MAIDPDAHASAFVAYCRLRRFEESEARLALLKEQVLSYTANLSHIRAMRQGERPSKWKADSLKRSSEMLSTKRKDALDEILEINRRTAFEVPASDLQLTQEFARICAIPQIIEIEVMKDGLLVIRVRARFTLEDVLYDLGDWDIPLKKVKRIDQIHVGEEVRWRRNSLKDDWDPTQGPSYLLEDGTFCFGDNIDPINSYFRMGKYEAGIQLAVYSLCSVNEDHIAAVPLAFHTFDEYQEMEPLWQTYRPGPMTSMLSVLGELGRMLS